MLGSIVVIVNNSESICFTTLQFVHRNDTVLDSVLIVFVFTVFLLNLRLEWFVRSHHSAVRTYVMEKRQIL